MKLLFGSNYCVKPPHQYYWAWFILNTDNTIHATKSATAFSCVNNVEACYLALIDALQYIKENQITDVTEYATDCPSVVNHLRKTWTTDNKKFLDLIEEVQRLIPVQPTLTIISRQKNRLVAKECNRLKRRELERKEDTINQILSENLDSD